MSKIVLSDLIAVTTNVEIAPGKELPIRALTLNEIAQLVISYREAAINLFNEAKSEVPNYPLVLAALPLLVADIIAYGADLEDQKDTILKLAPGTQIQLLEAIWSISVPDAKKLLESLSKLMEQVKRLAPSENPVPQNSQSTSQS